MAVISKTPAILSSEILLKSSDYTGCFILLEGDFDQRFWTPRFNCLSLKLINCVGKNNVLDTLDLFLSDSRAQKIIALVDVDFDRILARQKQISQLIYTDKNDLEVTLLHCSSTGGVSALDRILEESCDKDRLDLFVEGFGCSVVELLQKMAANYGVLRLVNEELQSGVNFHELPILHGDFLNHIDLVQDVNTLKNYFVNAVNNVGKRLISVEALDRMIELHRANGLFSDWQLVQGHDLMQLLSVFMNSKILRLQAGHRQVSEDSLARDLCLMTTQNGLENTGMCRNLISLGKIRKFDFLG